MIISQGQLSLKKFKITKLAIKFYFYVTPDKVITRHWELDRLISTYCVLKILCAIWIVFSVLSVKGVSSEQLCPSCYGTNVSQVGFTLSHSLPFTVYDTPGKCVAGVHPDKAKHMGYFAAYWPLHLEQICLEGTLMNLSGDRVYYIKMWHLIIIILLREQRCDIFAIAHH